MRKLALGLNLAAWPICSLAPRDPSVQFGADMVGPQASYTTCACTTAVVLRRRAAQSAVERNRRALLSLYHAAPPCQHQPLHRIVTEALRRPTDFADFSGASWALNRTTRLNRGGVPSAALPIPQLAENGAIL
jgi:hypothetical protein